MKRNQKNYIKIWEQHSEKKLPAGYEIHHIDGNRNNNDPVNLLAVTIREHFEIHKKQNDYGAMQALLMRMNRTENENLLLRDCASKHQLKLLSENRHNFQINSQKREIAFKSMMKKRIEENGSSFLGINDTVENGRNARSKLSREKELKMMEAWHEKVKGSVWWNNGVINKRSKEKPGNDFVKGMKK
jgi:hypothetical protein